MNKVKAVSYNNNGDRLGELVFEDFTPFEAALAIQKDFSKNGLDTEVEGGPQVDADYNVIVCYTGIEVKVSAIKA